MVGERCFTASSLSIMCTFSALERGKRLKKQSSLVEPDAGHLVQHFHPVVVEQDALAVAGQHLDATATILEQHPCHHMPLLAAVCNLCRLSVCHSVRHGDASAKLVVDVVHHLSKQAAVG